MISEIVDEFEFQWKGKKDPPLLKGSHIFVTQVISLLKPKKNFF
jgi:hypothetical protein